MRVVIKPAVTLHQFRQRIFPGMPEWGMTKIMRKGHRLDEFLVQPERARYRPCDLGDLKRMGKPGAVVIPFVVDKNLSLVFQPAKSSRIYYLSGKPIGMGVPLRDTDALPFRRSSWRKEQATHIPAFQALLLSGSHSSSHKI